MSKGLQSSVRIDDVVRGAKEETVVRCKEQICMVPALDCLGCNLKHFFFSDLGPKFHFHKEDLGIVLLHEQEIWRTANGIENVLERNCISVLS